MIKKQLINDELDNLLYYLKNIYFNLENPNEYVEFVKKESFRKQRTNRFSRDEQELILILKHKAMQIKEIKKLVKLTINRALKLKEICARL